MTNLDERVMEEIDYATFVNIISNIPSCIFYKDTDLKYRFSSHCWAQLNSDDIIGKTDLEIRKDKENAVMAMEADREIIRNKKGCHYVIKSEVDDDCSYLELIKEPIIGEDGEAIGIVGLINDVTEKTLLDQKLKEMSNQLAHKCEELENTNRELKATLERVEKMHASQKLLTASMNHELRSPLNGIIGSLQILMEDQRLNEKQYDFAYNAYQSSQMMLNIVNDLLDLARMEINEFAIRKEPFVFPEILGNIRHMGRTMAEAKNLHFEVVMPENVNFKLLGDKNRIQQIIVNLVSNGIKYTAEGFVKLKVGYGDGNLRIECSDSGQGIPEEEKGRLFDPFVRINEVENLNIKGTGLGLSVVKRLIDKMEGTIAVESEVGKGSTFTVVIPLVLWKEEAAETKKQKQNITVDFSRLRMLCVDDTKVNVVVMTGLLKQMGAVVDRAFSGAEAIELAEKTKYDVIFMDHQMPEMDGVETFRRIREESSMNKDTPIVMLTGNADEESKELYRQAGLDGYLEKPVLKEQIQEMVQRLI